jgi:hypothetical protein
MSGKRAYCAPPEIKGHEIMTAFEGFVTDHPQMAGSPYGSAMATTLSRAFPCSADASAPTRTEQERRGADVAARGRRCNQTGTIVDHLTRATRPDDVSPYPYA